ncbi:phosphate-starvation-inducible PsiE family protein [Trichocoleus desertorum AS-A10]|uniref:phosphate-starvation-inducible PsiE family protein n=1 Tax=Trichocoleus desertorum TaxID=1481672 RepID=UPI003298D659
MRSLKKVTRQCADAGSNENFLRFLGGAEALVSRALSIAMVVVLAVAVIDLVRFLVLEIFSEPFGLFSTTLIEIFGLFLNILIALEILENIAAYLRKHVVQVELVVVTSLIAVARKIIILDFEKTTGVELIGLAIAIFSLSISYWVVRHVNAKEP